MSSVSQALKEVDLFELSPFEQFTANILIALDNYKVETGAEPELKAVSHYIREATETNPSHLRIVPEEADARLLSMDAEGLSATKIANQLNRESFLTDRLQHGRWSPSLVRDALKVLRPAET